MSEKQLLQLIAALLGAQLLYTLYRDWKARQAVQRAAQSVGLGGATADSYGLITNLTTAAGGWATDWLA